MTQGLFTSGLSGLNRANRMFAQSSERLSTGLRINRGSDDPSGLIASEALGARVSELGARVRVLDRATLESSIAEGYLGAAQSTLSGISSLVVQGANSAGLTGAESRAIGASLSSAVQGLQRIGDSSGSDVLSGVSVREQVGTDGSGDPIYETYTISDLPELAESNPELAQELVREASSAIAEYRAGIGAQQRSDEALARASETEAINTASARSAIRDADYAAEIANQTRASILTKSSIQVLRIGQNLSRNVLDLLG
jgi:flagellin